MCVCVCVCVHKTFEQPVPMVKIEKDTENKLIEKVTSPAVGTVHVKAPTFDGSSHWV